MTPEALRRWLIASVVVNVFLVCGIAGGAWRWWSAAHAATQAQAAPAAAQPRGLRFAADDLPAEHRQAYRARLRDARNELADPIRAARAGRQDVMRILAAPEFDRAAAQAALARVRDADLLQRAKFESVVIDFAATLPPEERQQFAAGLAQRSNLAPRRLPAKETKNERP